MEAAVTTPHEPTRFHHPPADWPVDSDIDARGGGRRIDPALVAIVAAGGFLGGLARYEIVKAWAAGAGGFPWSTFAVNTAGAFVLAVLVIVTTDVLTESRYLRPLIGTGFCGALTTFSSVVVTADQLGAHSQLGTAVAYVAGSLLAGGAAAWLGVLVGRSLPLDEAVDSGGAL
jgi:CrcB protein